MSFDTLAIKDAGGSTVNLLGKNVSSAFAVGHIPVATAEAAGCSVYRNLDLGTTGQIVKASYGQIYGATVFNAAAAVRYIKIYDKATAPTSSDTPKLTIPIPAGALVPLDIVMGLVLTTGISLRATTGLADNDTGAPTANDVIVNFFYA